MKTTLEQVSRQWAAMDENLARKIYVLLKTPTPSCRAFKEAFRRGVVPSVPSFAVRRDAGRRPNWSCLGRAMPKSDDLPVCGECRDTDVFSKRSRPLWAGNADSGHIEVWRISEDVCHDCRRAAQMSDLGSPFGGDIMDLDGSDQDRCVHQ